MYIIFLVLVQLVIFGTCLLRFLKNNIQAVRRGRQYQFTARGDGGSGGGGVGGVGGVGGGKN